jgi:NAD-reducing hydrogenase small subunit
MGGIPAMRNMIPLQECMEEAFVGGPTVYNPEGLMPNDKTRSCHCY